MMNGPKIYIEVVVQLEGGRKLTSRKEISLDEYSTAHGETIAKVAIDSALADVGYSPRSQRR